MYMGSPSPAPLLPHALASIRSEGGGVSKKVCCLDTSRISVSSPQAHRLTLTLAYFNSNKAQPRLPIPTLLPFLP